MMKSLRSGLRTDREKYVLPRSVQDYIPINEVYENGIFRSGNRYSKCYGFRDINYMASSQSEKENVFLLYSELLNSLDSDALSKITINNRKSDGREIEKDVLIRDRNDGLDCYRDEYNGMLRSVSQEQGGINSERYITVSAQKQDISSAETYFRRITSDLSSRFQALGSDIVEIGTEERLSILKEIYTSDNEGSPFDMKDSMKLGHSFKDYISPDGIERAPDHIKLGNRYARVLFLKDYASYIKDTMISDLCDMKCNMMLSIDIMPIPTDEAVREVENRLLGIDTNITNWQRRQNRYNNFSASVPFDLEQQRKESREFLEDLTSRDQRMMCATVTLVHFADTKEQLDSDTEAVMSCASKHMCRLAVLRYQQMEGLSTVLPIGCRKINVMRTLTTESLSVLMPFRVRNICEPGGIYYGQNAISGNMIVSDRTKLLNGNSFILGVSGSGKSFAAKNEIVSLMLKGNSDIIIIDPEREYGELTKAFGGEIIDISAGSRNHINAMDVSRDYGDGDDPLILKSEFILSLCEQLSGTGTLGPKEKSVIDRCVRQTYRDYGSFSYTPTLRDFRKVLLSQGEPEAEQIALALELFTDGSLDTFAKQTNVDTGSRLICYDILDLGKQLLPAGMLVVLDSVLNRITRNRMNGRNTFIFIDEIYLLFRHEYSADFLFTLWKRVRKYGAFCTGITQNVDDLLQSHQARTMLANSEFVIMLNQAATDRESLSELMGISDEESAYITNVGFGKGLIKNGSSLVPFTFRFPKDTKLYGLMSTDTKKKEKEDIHGKEQKHIHGQTPGEYFFTVGSGDKGETEKHTGNAGGTRKRMHINVKKNGWNI